jgi:DNA repair photolyase
MRWDELKVEEEQRRALPGYREGAEIRTFDAPEALDTRFYEVRSKSVLNRVPERSAMPFRWTINPYRGCTHACTYCSAPDTPILMGDGRTKPIAEVRAGDWVYGTVRRGSYLRYRASQVRDHWITKKDAFRVTLEDGTELVTSGDHRFLTDRGWKHVADAPRGCQRPHLTLTNKLMGTGAYERQPDDWPDYRRGYLSGIVRGDGHLAAFPYVSPTGRRMQLHRFRLALIDHEALRRAACYLEGFGVRTTEFAFPTKNGRHSMRAIRNQSRAGVSAVMALIEWPRTPRPEWCRGFLAGIFDAEGHHGQVIRISNTDPEIIGRTAEALRVLGFPFVVEDLHRPNGIKNVRLTGGLRRKLAFFHTVDPAIARKREIEGIPLKSQSKLRVEEIEPLGKGFELHDITTGTGDFIANGVVSHNCFARPTHVYLGFDAARDFEKEIVVKVNAPEVVRAELSRPSWKHEHVALGTNTDPYQWVEGRYRLMPGIWDALADSGTPGSVLSKSPLVLRDIDHMQRVPGISANFSVPTLEEKAWRATEPHTPHPRARLEAVAELNRVGIPCGILVAPLMPGINDAPEQVERILELAEEAGAVSVGGIGLHLRGETRQVFFDWLESKRPDLLPLYRRLYSRGAYLPRQESNRLAALTRGRGRRHISGGRRWPEDYGPGPGPPAEAEPAQESLF